MDLDQERNQHLINIETFKSNAVAYNKAHSLQERDYGANGASCWELAETMTYLFTVPTPNECSDPEIHKFASFTMHSECLDHCAVVLDGLVYEMCDGVMTINKYVDDEQVLKLSSNLIQEEIVEWEVEYFRVRNPFETAVLIANLR
jgi:hypothetical protein